MYDEILDAAGLAEGSDLNHDDKNLSGKNE